MESTWLIYVRTFRWRKSQVRRATGIWVSSLYSNRRSFAIFFGWESLTGMKHAILLRNGYFSGRRIADLGTDKFKKPWCHRSSWTKCATGEKTREKNNGNFQFSKQSRARSTAAVVVELDRVGIHWHDSQSFKSPHLCASKNCAPRFF